MLVTWQFGTAGIVLALSQRRRRALTMVLMMAAELSLFAMCLVMVPTMLRYGRLAMRILIQ
jgi:hypothetical protein